jgi:DNA invertase Pin-like site-specific DNA recombinase
MIRKVALYCRVSTSKQEADNQLLQLKEFAGRNGWEIYREYTDIISGKEMSRPAFDQLFLDAHKRLFDAVLFWDLSRFSRSGTLFTLQKLQELWGLNIEWISYQEPYIRSIGQFSDVVVSLLATLAKIEREKISQRTKAGLERVRVSGKRLGRPGGRKDSRKRKRTCWKKY